MESFGRSVLLPSYTRQPHFTTSKSETHNFDFGCVNCEEHISIDFYALIQGAAGSEDAIGSELMTRAKEFYAIGVVGKAQDGGWPSMLLACCDHCHTEYLVYAGVDEVYNSLYQVTIQGINELLTS